MKVKNKKRRVKDEKMETPLRAFFIVHYSLFSYFLFTYLDYQILTLS